MRFIKDITSEGSIYLDLEDTKLDSNFDESLLHFNADTYNNLRPNQSVEGFDHTYRYPNMFLQTLSADEKKVLAVYILSMHYEIICTLNTNNINLDDPLAEDENNVKMYRLDERLASYMRDVDVALNLYNRMLEFTTTNVEIRMQKDAGDRPQDSVEMSFYLGEQRILATWFIICKLFAGISGEFLEKCKDINIDRSLAEGHCATIYKYILRGDDIRVSLYNKLENYTANAVTSVMKEVNKEKCKDANYVYTGNTTETIISKAIDVILSRKAVTYNFDDPTAVFMSQVRRMILNVAQNCKKTSNKDVSVSYRSNPNSNKTADDENNDSILEHESANTSCTADINLIISFAVKDIIKRYTEKYSFSPDTINKSIAYYSEFNHISVNPLNSYILCVLFGDDLLGARSIELLTGKDLAALTTIAQLYFIEHHYLDLVHLISLQPTGRMKSTLSGSESKLRSAYMNNTAYRECDNRFTFTINDTSWYTPLNELIKNLTTYVYKINTAIPIWSELDEQPVNGQDYIAPDILGEEICRLILQCTDDKEQ